MKAILVIKMPSECGWGCPCYRDSMYSDGFCSAICENVSAKRPTNCPLKPMPNKLDANDWHRMFGGTYEEREAKGYGWNACIEEICNEQNERKSLLKTDEKSVSNRGER